MAVVIYFVLGIEFVLNVKRDKRVRPIPDETYVPLTVSGGSSSQSKPVSSEELNGISKGQGYAKMSKNIRLMLLGLGISTVLIIVRSVYRTIEVCIITLHHSLHL